MQGLQRGVCTAALWALCTGSALAQSDPFDSPGFEEPSPLRPMVVAERVERTIPVYSASGLVFPLREINAPGASFIRIHFSRFRLPEGIELEISNPDGSESWRYSVDHKDPITLDGELQDDGIDRFSAMSITGDTALIRLLGDLAALDPNDHQVEIDSWLEGLPLGQSISFDPKAKENDWGEGSQLENACGSDERWGSVCWANSNPWEYSRSAAVARLVTSKGVVCTAWRVGSDNHMFTAEHCIGKQSDLDGSEIWFNYESTSCGSSSTTTPVKVTGGTLLSRDGDLDYALFTVNNFSQIAQFPAFGLETDTPPVGEPIFIPQHGLGMPRQISIESDMNVSGECEVDATDVDGFFSDSDIGYYCDTATSSSGSPVVSNVSGRVVALHHFGGCMNSGVKMSQIWPDVEGFFGGQVPSGNSGGSGGGSSGSGNGAPQAQFSVQCDDLSCLFDGSDSFDNDGNIVDFSWDLGNGVSKSGMSVAYEYSVADTYEVTLTVEDDEGEKSTATQSVTVELSNKEPRARFSFSCISNRCTFDANGSYDEDGEIEGAFWMLGDGRTAAGFVVEHEYEEAGTYNVQLTATDDQGASDSSLKQVTVVLANDPPTASFDYSCDELECSFDSSGSKDSDGEIVGWSWRFGDGATAEGEQALHRYPQSGSFDVSLTVTDNRGDTDSSTKTISPSTANSAPNAAFSFHCAELDCSFDGSGSTDPDGNVTAWNWSFGDGGTSSGALTSHRFKAEGTYSVSLAVSDDDSDTDTQTRSVKVSLTNRAPEASFTYACSDLECTFDGTSSVDSDGQVTAWAWSFGDGARGSGANLTHRFGDEGAYTVTLTVSDDDGATGLQAHSVQVSMSAPPPEPEPTPGTNQRPQAEFSYSCNQLECVFDSSGSRDSDGNIRSHLWTFSDGSTASGEVTGHRFGAGGSYQVSLTVQDNDGAEDTRTRTVSVEEQQSNTAPRASFSFECDARACRFDASSSSDTDGEITAYRWTMGDGASLSGKTVQHQFGAAGTYQVTLTVVDNDGKSGMSSRSIEAEEETPTIVLSGSGRQNNNKIMATLRWSGAESQRVDLYRDGAFLTNTRNDGKLIDTTFTDQTKSAAYRLCQAGSGVCSNTVTIDFSIVSR